MQQALKSASGTARAEVVAAKPFAQFDVTVDDALPAFDLGFRGE
jgi:hypothetical protein